MVSSEAFSCSKFLITNRILRYILILESQGGLNPGSMSSRSHSAGRPDARLQNQIARPSPGPDQRIRQVQMSSHQGKKN